MLEEMGGRDGVFEELLGGEVENFSESDEGLYTVEVCSAEWRGNESDRHLSV